MYLISRQDSPMPHDPLCRRAIGRFCNCPGFSYVFRSRMEQQLVQTAEWMAQQLEHKLDQHDHNRFVQAFLHEAKEQKPAVIMHDHFPDSFLCNVGRRARLPPVAWPAKAFSFQIDWHRETVLLSNTSVVVHEYVQDADSFGWSIRALFQWGFLWGTASVLLSTQNGEGYPTEREGKQRTKAEVMQHCIDNSLVDWHVDENSARAAWAEILSRRW